MTLRDRPLAVRNQKPGKWQRAKTFLRKNCVPSLIEDILVLRREKEMGASVSKADYGKAAGKYAGRIATSAAIQFGVGMSVGVTALQTEAGAPSTKWLHESSSPVAKSIGAFVAGMIPPHAKETWANILLGADMVLSAGRIALEQVLWRYCKVTPDSPGTAFSPLLVGVAEMGYKTMALANTPDNPDMRLAQGFAGVYGNVVRLVATGAIALGAYVWNKVSKKKEPPQGGNHSGGKDYAERRNDFGVPMQKVRVDYPRQPHAAA